MNRKETATQRKRRLLKAKLKRREKIAKETADERRLRLEKNRLSAFKRRASEKKSLEQLDRIHKQETIINNLIRKIKYENRIKREEGPSSSQVDDEGELEVEIQVKQEINDDPLSLNQVKAEPLDDSEHTDGWEPSKKTRPSDTTGRNGEPSAKFVEVSIKNEYDEAFLIEENEIRIDIKEEKD